MIRQINQVTQGDPFGPAMRERQPVLVVGVCFRNAALQLLDQLFEAPQPVSVGIDVQSYGGPRPFQQVRVPVIDRV